MKTAFRLVLIPLLILAFNTCKRDIIPPFIKCGGSYIRHNMKDCSFTQSATKGKVYDSPSSNPNDVEELVFIEDGTLVKYHMETKEKTTLVNSLDRILTPDWGSSGWIVFSAGWKIWKVRDNGTELQQISNNPRDLNPEFNHNGELVIYARNMDYSTWELKQNPELAYRTLMLIVDNKGVAFDSICIDIGKQCKGWSYSSWAANGKIAHVDGNDNGDYGVSSYDMNTRENVDIFTNLNFDRHGPIEDIEWHPTNDRIYFRERLGIRYVDPEKGKVKKFRTSCADQFYEDFTITSDGKHIIAVKGEATANKDECLITTEKYLVRMEINGSKEERIFID